MNKTQCDIVPSLEAIQAEARQSIFFLYNNRNVKMCNGGNYNNHVRGKKVKNRTQVRTHRDSILFQEFKDTFK